MLIICNRVKLLGKKPEEDESLDFQRRRDGTVRSLRVHCCWQLELTRCAKIQTPQKNSCNNRIVKNAEDIQQEIASFLTYSGFKGPSISTLKCRKIIEKERYVLMALQSHHIYDCKITSSAHAGYYSENGSKQQQQQHQQCLVVVNMINDLLSSRHRTKHASIGQANVAIRGRAKTKPARQGDNLL